MSELPGVALQAETGLWQYVGLVNRLLVLLPDKVREPKAVVLQHNGRADLHIPTCCATALRCLAVMLPLPVERQVVAIAMQQSLVAVVRVESL